MLYQRQLLLVFGSGSGAAKEGMGTGFVMSGPCLRLNLSSQFILLRFAATVHGRTSKTL